ncbi:MAG: urate hydroxylase PuuD, partial [Pseudomonadota bacterium]|nr:urate hydroxylase PuuD [Pseudomonadota bacterium]
MDAFWLAYGTEWLSLLTRWLHLITGIAWIGASFYFVWLDNSIRPPAPGSELAQKGVSGELWAVHGGGFYHPQKYLLAPATLPPILHWFKWEAYATWLSGVALLILVYYVNAASMMVDASVAPISSAQAIGTGVASLVVAWAVYDGLCRTALVQHQALFGALILLLLTGAAWVLSQWLSARAAYLHVGAMIGTMMVGNVLMVIIPGQKKMVSAMRAGQTPDPIYGQCGKQRSVHNNYFTLPVLFIMISNHYAMTYQHAHSWAVLGVIMTAGVLIRHFFNLRHRGRTDWRFPLAGLFMLGGLAVAIAPTPSSPSRTQANQARTGASLATFTDVEQIIARRCVACHAAHPTQPGFAVAPAGILLDRPELIHRYGARIIQQ